MRKLLFAALMIAPMQMAAQPQDIAYVIARYREASEQIEKIEYQAHAIDTFTSGNVWNRKGYALLEKDNSDSLFGFSFYGTRYDLERSTLFEVGTALEIQHKTQSYKRSKEIHYGLLGSIGGQMIAEEIFHQDLIMSGGDYKEYSETCELIETPEKFILKYRYKDIIKPYVNNTNRFKFIELDRESYLVTKVVLTYAIDGSKGVHEIILSDIKINDEVQHSVSGFKKDMEKYTEILPKKKVTNPLLSQPVPNVELPTLDGSTSLSLNTGKVTLLDFWEIWCGPCIASLPKVEEFSQKYADKLRVIGIVSQDKEKVKARLEKNSTSYPVLFGDKETHKTFSVNSFPRYFLIDHQGIIRHEYHGFSEQIEKDIVSLIEDL